MFNFQASIQASSQQRPPYPGPDYLQDFYNNTRYCYELKCGPGQRGFSGHSQRFPSLECEAYPRDLLVDLFVVQESFYFGLRKAVTSQLPPLVVTLWLSFSFFWDFVSFIMWCIQLTTFIVGDQASIKPGGRI